MNISEMENNPFIAKVNGRYYILQDPIATLEPDADFHIELIPIPNGKIDLDNIHMRYFTWKHEFDVVQVLEETYFYTEENLAKIWK